MAAALTGEHAHGVNASREDKRSAYRTKGEDDAVDDTGNDLDGAGCVRRRRVGPGSVMSGHTRRPDADLIARFERDVLPHRATLRRRALRLTRDVQEAEDLTQDTLLNAFAGFRSFRDGTDPMAWLSRIMHNSWINRWRKRQRAVAEVSASHITDEELSLLAAPGRNSPCSAEAAALNALPDSEIKAALMSLDEVFRVTIYYADVEGFSNKEIAAVMGSPLGTVMSRLHRGRQRLRQSLMTVADARGYTATPAPNREHNDNPWRPMDGTPRGRGAPVSSPLLSPTG